MPTLFDDIKQTPKVKQKRRFYKGAKGRFASKVQSEIDFWKAKYKVEKGNASYYKNYAKRLERRLNNERQIQTPPSERR